MGTSRSKKTKEFLLNKRQARCEASSIMWSIQLATLVGVFLVLLGLNKVYGKTTCDLAPYKLAKSVSQITTNLQNVVSYCEKKIVEIEARKKTLENEMRQLETQNVKFAKEKRDKEKKLK